MTDARRSERQPPRGKTAEKTKRLASFPLLNPNPVLEVDESGKITFANPGARKVLKSLGLDGRDLRPFLPGNMNTILKMLAAGKRLSLRREVAIQDHVFGETLHLYPMLKAIRIYVYDITARNRAELALRDSEAKYRLLFKNMAEGFALYELLYDDRGQPVDWRVLEVNEAYFRHTGIAREQIVGRRMSEFLPAAIPEYLPRFAKVVAAQTPDEFETHSPVVDRDLHIFTFPVGHNRFASTISDITLRKKAEQVLRRSHEELEELVRQRTDEIKKKDEHIRRAQKIEALGTLAGGIAHDFNNILSTIMINTELTLLDLSGPDRDRSPLSLVLQAAHRGRDLVKQIITFSRQREQERKPVRVSPIIKDALKFLGSSLAANIEIHSDIEETADVVRADPSQIHQVLMNLCNNAAYAMRETGGVLEIMLKAVDVDTTLAAKHPDLKPGPHLRLVVSDSGCGMTPDVRERAFDPFFTTKGHGEGSGLGLAVVHGIVRSYGGGMTLYSEVGRGSTFNLFLPRVLESVEPDYPPIEAIPGGKERVLVVDDETAQLQSFMSMLERLGYRVTARTDGREALADFQRDPDRFDLVITDQTMPTMTGRELAEAILKIRPDLPIILSTGFSEVVDGDKARLSGIREFIFKPFSLRDISTTIRRALESPQKEERKQPKARRRRP